MSDRVRWNKTSECQPKDGQYCVVCGFVAQGDEPEHERMRKELREEVFTATWDGGVWMMSSVGFKSLKQIAEPGDMFSYWLPLPPVTQAMLSMVFRKGDDNKDALRRLDGVVAKAEADMRDIDYKREQCKAELDDATWLRGGNDVG